MYLLVPYGMQQKHSKFAHADLDQFKVLLLRSLLRSIAGGVLVLSTRRASPLRNAPPESMPRASTLWQESRSARHCYCGGEVQAQLRTHGRYSNDTHSPVLQCSTDLTEKHSACIVFINPENPNPPTFDTVALGANTVSKC